MDQKDEVYISRWTDTNKWPKNIWDANGSFVYGTPYRLSVGKNPIMVRVPAFKINGIYFIVDGVHRTSQLQPAMIIMDYVELKKSEALIVVDFVGKFFKNKIK